MKMTEQATVSCAPFAQGSAQWRCFRAQDKKRIVKDKNQLQEQLIYLGSGFIESYKCYTLSTSTREIHPVSHVSRGKDTWLVQAGGTA